MLGLNGFDTSPGWYMNSVMNWWIANLNWCRIFWSNCAIAMNLPKFVIFVNPCWRQLVEVDFLRFIQRVLDFTEFTSHAWQFTAPETTKSRTTWKSSWNEKRNHSSPTFNLGFQNVPFRRRTDSAPEHCFKKPTAFMRVPSMKWGNIALMYFFPKIFKTWRFPAFALLGGQFPTILTVLFSVSWWLFSTTEVVDPYKFLGIKISCIAGFIFPGQRFIHSH